MRRIAVVNWRDPWHKGAGGAELFAWQVATRLAGEGAAVTFVTARDEGQSRTEVLDGVKIVRMGGRLTVYPRVLAWLGLRRGRFDGVVDCQNGIPFFTPWVTSRRVPVVCVMHHVHDHQFGHYFPPAVARFGRFLEGPVARRAYRRYPAAAVSTSTIRAMRERLRWTGDIHLVPNGTDPVSALPRTPTPDPTIVCVGRLVPTKRVEHVITMAVELREQWPGLTVRIIGRGPDGERLAALAEELDLGDTVRFEGFISVERKAELVAEAWLQVTASAGEGWGLNVLEAAGLGVPTVAPDVEGLRDAVLDGRTGWLAPSIESLTATVSAALKEVADPVRAAELDAACREWAAGFDWDATTRRVNALLNPPS